MEPRDLFNIWNAPDHSKLTPKQISIRLPIQVAAKINALCDIFPRKNKTEIIGDLLATALDQLASAMPSEKGREISTDPDTGETLYEDVGLGGRFIKLTYKYLRELEKESGIKELSPAPTPVIYGEKD